MYRCAQGKLPTSLLKKSPKHDESGNDSDDVDPKVKTLRVIERLARSDLLSQNVSSFQDSRATVAAFTTIIP